MTLHLRLSLLTAGVAIALAVTACRTRTLDDEPDPFHSDGGTVLDFTVVPPDFFVPPPFPDILPQPIDLTSPMICGEPTVPPTLPLLRKEMVGAWLGVANSPWSNPYKVTITFNADDTYSAHSFDPNQTVFNYGVDDDSPAKTYLVDNILSNGDGMGEIQIFWGGTETTQGSLEHVRVCGEQLEHMSFEFWATWSGRYGPIRYELGRQ